MEARQTRPRVPLHGREVVLSRQSPGRRLDDLQRVARPRNRGQEPRCHKIAVKALMLLGMTYCAMKTAVGFIADRSTSGGTRSRRTSLCASRRYELDRKTWL